MHREFLDLYNRELQLLYEQARDFAAEYPGIAERLGGLVADRMDPMVGGLLEGAAFLAARVQLKLKHEFPEFTANLLEQLVPDYLAPSPSALLAKITPSYADPALREGRLVRRGSYFDASYRELDRQIACRFRLCANVTLWPFEIASAEYYQTPAPLQALGLAVGSNALAGLRLSLTHRTAAKLQDEIPDVQAKNNPAAWFAGCRTRELTVHLVGLEADAIAVYEQLFARNVGIYFRFLDQFGDPVILSSPQVRVEQLGFGDEDGLLGNDQRIFRGFEFLREYFMFPRKFLGFSLTGLDKVLRRANARSIDILFVFNEVNSRLAATVRPDMFSLYTAPAVNLFEKTTDRIPVRANQHEYHVVPDRSHYLDFEAHRIMEVYGHYPGRPDKVPVPPLYAASMDVAVSDQKLSYTVRRLPRRYSVEEKKYGKASDYTGTDMFLSLLEPAGIHDETSLAELSVRALCSNRHLTEHLPVGEGGADFRLLDDIMLDVVCVAGPTKPREPVVSQHRGRTESAYTGTVAWRLINMLSLNHLGLVERGAGKDGQSLREVLAMFGDIADSATERKIRGVRSVSSRPIVRRVSRPAGSAIARGIEIEVTLDDKAFEGSGAFLLGAVLDRFFAEYVGLNHFTQTVVRTVERGEIMRWPARIGVRHPI